MTFFGCKDDAACKRMASICFQIVAISLDEQGTKPIIEQLDRKPARDQVKLRDHVELHASEEKWPHFAEW